MGRLAKNPDLIRNAGIAESGLLPSGVTGERPTTPINGATRYNETNSALEYWSGAAWEQVSKTGLTLIVADSLTGANGIKTVFGSGDGVSQTIAAVTDILVFVGGVYQTPTTNYTVSGTDITFTSAPPAGAITVVHNLNQVT